MWLGPFRIERKKSVLENASFTQTLRVVAIARNKTYTMETRPTVQDSGSQLLQGLIVDRNPFEE